MFDFLKEIKGYIGCVYNYQGLRMLMRDIRLRNLGEIAPEINVDDMIRMALNNGWLKEDEQGFIHVKDPL